MNINLLAAAGGRRRCFTTLIPGLKGRRHNGLGSVFGRDPGGVRNGNLTTAIGKRKQWWIVVCHDDDVVCLLLLCLLSICNDVGLQNTIQKDLGP